MKKNKIEHYSDKEALDFHNTNKSGKIEIISSKPMTSKRDLALAYSPGVAAPVKAISKNKTLSFLTLWTQALEGDGRDALVEALKANGFTSSGTSKAPTEWKRQV